MAKTIRVTEFVQKTHRVSREEVARKICGAKRFQDSIDLYASLPASISSSMHRVATIPCPPKMADSSEEELLEYARNNLPKEIDFTY